MLTDVSVIDFAMDVDVWKCLLNWFSRVPGMGDGRKTSQENDFGSSISQRYLNIYPVIHIYPCTGATFWVKNIMFLGRYTSAQSLSNATHRDLSYTDRVYNNTHKFAMCSSLKIIRVITLSPTPAGKIWAGEMNESRFCYHRELLSR